MIVSAAGVHGSIGGGNLEFTAIALAREFLQEADTPKQFQQAFGLGPELNQCCGGAVYLLFERLPSSVPQWLEQLAHLQAGRQPVVLASSTGEEAPRHFVIHSNQRAVAGCPDNVHQAASRMLEAAGAEAGAVDGCTSQELENEDGHWWLERIEDHRAELWLFGAGHVGQEVAQRTRGLPFRLTWLDQRPGIFPVDAAQFARLYASDPVLAVQSARPGVMYVVMTHSHILDEEICHAILQRSDFHFLGLIGSATKRKRFVHRLRQRGIQDHLLARLVCPIGLAGIHGKQPATIATSLLAQLMMGPAEEKS